MRTPQYQRPRSQSVHGRVSWVDETPDPVTGNREPALVVIDTGETYAVHPVGLTVAVKGQLRVGHDGVEKQMLHHAVPRYIGHAVHGAPVNGGGGDDVWLLLGFLRLLGRLRGGVGGLRLRSVIAGLGGRVRLGRAAAGGERTGQQKG